MTKRLSPEMIDDAYEKIGATPRRNEFYDCDTSSGCGMGVYAIAELGCDPDWLDSAFQSKFMDSGYDSNYRRGFAWGFDGDELDPEYDQDVMENEMFMLGYPDGQAAWEKVKVRLSKNP